AEVTDLALPDHVVEGPERLIERRLEVRGMGLIEIEVIRLQPPRLPSIAVRICLRESPCSLVPRPIAPQHLVASTICSRFPLSHFPTISSVRPTRSSPPPTGYTFAVSKKSTPAANA